MLSILSSDLWGGLISRTEGPLKFRFVLQPSMAILLAIRGGLSDSREGKGAFFWEFCFDPAKRAFLLRDCWQHIGKLFILAFLLDCGYQLIELRWIYVSEAVVISCVLAVIPYVIVRGPVNRIVTALRPAAPSTTKQPETPSSLKKAV